MTASSCKAGSDGPAGVSSRVIDSAGIAIVTSIRPVLGEADSWQTVESLVMGEASDSGHFFKIREARRLSDGRFVVISDARVMIVDRGGDIVRPIGARGDGPGEYRNPDHILISSLDDIIVWDVDYGPRITYDTTGALLREHHFDLSRIHSVLGDSASSENHIPFGEAGFVASLKFHEKEPSVGSRLERRREAAGLRLIADDYGSIFLGRVAGPLYFTFQEGQRLIVVLPLLHTFTHVSTGGTPLRVYASSREDASVLMWGSDGRLRQIVRRGSSLRRVDEEFYARMVKGWTRQVELSYGPGTGERYFARLPDQRYYPPVLGLFVEANGTLWVRETQSIWNVFDSAGTWISNVSIPLTKVFDVGPDFVVGMRVDPDGVEQLVELELSRGD